MAKLPKVKREAEQPDGSEQVQPFTQAEVATMLRGLRDRGNGLHLAVALGAGCGLRRGEVLALQWRDIEPGAIHVRGSINDLRERTAPKTASSRRTVEIKGALVDLIAAHRAKATATAAALGVPVREDDYLFPMSPDEPQKPQHPVSFGSRFQYQARKLGIKGAHFHRLRHYQASMLIDQGEQPASVAARLGHKDATVTLAAYTKAFDAAKAKAATTAAAALDEALALPQPSYLRAVK